MVLGLENIGLGDIGINLSVGGIIDKILLIALFVGIILVVGAAMFFVMRHRNKKKTPLKKIGWWEEVHGELTPTTMDEAQEITIPGTRLRVFYIKSRDMWLPRFSHGITKDLFYVCITPKRELVNFTLGSIQADMEKAGLKYDHTDMIWASENLRDYIKRNYRDKSTKWWQEYKDLISTVIHIMIHTFSFIVIIYFLRGLIGDIREAIGLLTQQINACKPAGSGIAPALFLMLRGDK